MVSSKESVVRVQVVDLDDESICHCTLDEFVDANPDVLDEEEMRSLLAGDRVVVGGGAAPAFAVELQR
jgi:hypothetical protein